MSVKKSIDTLVQDVYSLLDSGIELTDEQAALLGAEMAEAIRSQVRPRRERKASLYFSSIGKPDRQLWYEYKGVKGLPLHPSDKFKFLYGTLIEILMMNLARWSGHEVTEVQGRATLDVVTGRKDCRIDGVTVDVKSASTYSFEKFKEGTLFEKDPFGYIAQLSGYIQAGQTDGKAETGAFWAADKQHGHMALLAVPPSKQQDVLKTIEHKKKVVILDEPPERCYSPEPMGKSGNEVLPTGCSYCAYKEVCWADANDGVGLRTFLYSTGPKFFTKVVEEPRVNEIGNNASKESNTKEKETKLPRSKGQSGTSEL